MSEETKKDKLLIKDLSCSYGSTLAVDKVNLNVKENEITAFIGPSGCGKSTVLRSLNRMNDTIASSSVTGEVNVFLEGEEKAIDIYSNQLDIITLRRKVGMVFQRPNPFPLSIYENIAYGPRLFGINDKDKLDEIVETSLKYAVIWDDVKDKLHSASGMDLSGGQQQRLCIARALAVGPEVLLMDEPCSALDPIATLRIEDLLIQLKEHLTIVIVTHNMQQASRISDRTAVFWVDEKTRVGNLVEYQPTLELFSKPQDSRTEGYITGRFG